MRLRSRWVERLPICVCAVALALSGCAGGAATSSSLTPAPIVVATATPKPTVSATAAPSAAPVVASSSYSCPTSDVAASAVRGAAARVGDARRASVAHARRESARGSGTQLLAVRYDPTFATVHRAAMAARELSLGGTFVHEFGFSHTGVFLRIVAVPAARAAAVTSALRSTAGVRAVQSVGERRYPTAVNTRLFTSDPYFTGFSTPIALAAGDPVPAATYELGPLEESASVPGQWDMHAIRLDYAYAYSQANNGSGIVNPAALGSSAVKLAVIDTGEDTTHPELSGGKVAYQRCFVSDPSNVQSTSSFTTDEAGHGTDVAGIAGATSGNGLGFTGAGGAVSIYGYRVFPTPDDSCASDTSTDPVCGTSTVDVASAIADAVAQHVNVITMSIGGGQCVNGADSDAVEGAAVAEAIAANVIVVAAAGNAYGPPVEAPACNAGVLAVGATAIADGQTNGSGRVGGLATAPFEYVASYTDYGTPGVAVNSASAWGIVAPGGDPSGPNDVDNLHWIENIWTSTPYMSGPSDANFSGSCGPDYASTSGTTDCRILIAGTSMATPHVAGAAALILAVNPAYGSPATMKGLLCSTADDILDPNEGCGRLNVERAMAAALSDRVLPSPAPIP